MAEPKGDGGISDFRPTDPRDAFRGTLRHYRRNLGISQQRLADEAGISQVALSHFETGRFYLPMAAMARVRQALFNLVQERALAVNFFSELSSKDAPSILSTTTDLRVGA
jgi:transcriptional regulator with XRE-family HTH domain